MLEEAIYARLMAVAALTALVGTRIYPERAPSGATRPYLSYFQVSRVGEVTLGGSGGLTTRRYQLDIWDDSYLGAKALAEQVRLALDSFHGTVAGVPFNATLVNELDIPERGLETTVGDPLTHIAQDYLVMASETKPQEV